MDILRTGERSSGVYPIYIRRGSSDYADVYCDMETAGGGWMVSYIDDTYRHKKLAPSKFEPRVPERIFFWEGGGGGGGKRGMIMQILSPMCQLIIFVDLFLGMCEPWPAGLTTSI